MGIRPDADIREIEGLHVVCIDASGAFWYKALATRPDGGLHPRLALACPTRAEAERVAALDEYSGSQLFTTRRIGAVGRVATALPGHGVGAHKFGDLGDDAALKALHPPPAGIDVSFRWTPSDCLYRLDARTERKGAIVTRTVVLPVGAADLAQEVARAYGRFSRTSPAPAGDGALRCPVHAAALLERLDAPGAARLSAWADRLSRTPRHGRGDVRPLLLPGREVDSALVSITLQGARGSDEVVARLEYRGGNVLDGRRIRVAADLPHAMLPSLPGRSAAELWSAPELRDVTIGRHRSTTPRKDLPPVHEFEADAVLGDMPRPTPPPADQRAAAERLRRDHGGIRIQGVLASAMRTLDPATTLHIVRTLALQRDYEVDVRHMEGLGVRTIAFEDGMLAARDQGHVPMADLVPSLPLAA